MNFSSKTFGLGEQELVPSCKRKAVLVSSPASDFSQTFRNQKDFYFKKKSSSNFASFFLSAHSSVSGLRTSSHFIQADV